MVTSRTIMEDKLPNLLLTIGRIIFGNPKHRATTFQTIAVVEGLAVPAPEGVSAVEVVFMEGEATHRRRVEGATAVVEGEVGFGQPCDLDPSMVSNRQPSLYFVETNLASF
jgi:hypothetical protein